MCHWNLDFFVFLALNTSNSVAIDYLLWSLDTPKLLKNRFHLIPTCLPYSSRCIQRVPSKYFHISKENHWLIYFWETRLFDTYDIYIQLQNLSEIFLHNVILCHVVNKKLRVYSLSRLALKRTNELCKVCIFFYKLLKYLGHISSYLCIFCMFLYPYYFVSVVSSVWTS